MFVSQVPQYAHNVKLIMNIIMTFHLLHNFSWKDIKILTQVIVQARKSHALLMLWVVRQR